jgi:uncharacterized protein YbjT (DUF2867 family)
MTADRSRAYGRVARTVADLGPTKLHDLEHGGCLAVNRPVEQLASRAAGVPLPILVTGAAGGVGGVGNAVVTVLRQRGLPVRALAHREDERTEALRALGADVIVGDLLQPSDVADALAGCGRMFFSMSVSPSYLEAAATVATVARRCPSLEALVNLSQMTVSQMTAVSTDQSRHQRLHWLAEQVLNWSTVPVVHIRPTIFLENPIFTTLAARSVAEHCVIRLPFGRGHTSPIAAGDVARVAARVLQNPASHLGKVLELTGPLSQDMDGVAEEFSRALGKRIEYDDVPAHEWMQEILSCTEIPEHLAELLITVASLHRDNRYDRATRTVEQLTGRTPQSVESFVAAHAELFGAPSARAESRRPPH